MTEFTRIHAKITGRVQGVGYRAFCAMNAARLGITGYANNMSDGSVEVVAEGAPENVEEFLERLRNFQLWDTKTVEDLEVNRREETDERKYEGFTTGVG